MRCTCFDENTRHQCVIASPCNIVSPAIVCGAGWALGDVHKCNQLMKG
jgi:hypothetical protein